MGWRMIKEREGGGRRRVGSEGEEGWDGIVDGWERERHTEAGCTVSTVC
jgi:hypothetical protein